jgi:hypothetical protein
MSNQAIYLVLAALVLSAVAQTQDPIPPPGGFPIKYIKDNPITYSDGYRTMLDIRYPDVAAPTTGWPGAMVVHGGGGTRNKNWVVAIAERLTRAGYLTLAYDTGGHGVTTKLNPPGQRVNGLRIRDIAEIYYFAEQLMGSRLDSTRLATMGKSGGGNHSLWAASYSDRTLPVTGTLVSKMPKILAIHSDIQVLDAIASKLPGGNLIQADWMVDSVVRLGLTDPLSLSFFNRDYAALTTYLAGNPGTSFLPVLRQSDVPLFISYAYDDHNHIPNVNGDAMLTLKPGVPRRYFQTTGGHGTASNNTEVTLRRDFTQRWFDRFLKGIQNGVDQEPYAEIAMVANTRQAYQNAGSFWKHRHSTVWPIAPSKRYYLRTAGRLETLPPNAVEAGPTIRHRVAAGYTTRGFVADRGNPGNVISKIPFVQASFDTPPLQNPQELLGRSTVELDLVLAGNTEFQLSAALLDVPPTGSPRFITSGVAARRQVSAGTHRLKIILDDVGYVLRAGHRLRVSLENLNLRRQPGHGHFYAIPEFRDYDLTVTISPAFAPRVDLPVQPARASLTPRIARLRGSSGFQHSLNYLGESSRAGEIYQAFLSASGAWPGVNLPPHVPLNIDIFTTIAIDLVNTPLFVNFLGQLDARGRARLTFALPAPIAAATVGMRFNFVGISVDGSNRYSVTNPVELIIEP